MAQGELFPGGNSTATSDANVAEITKAGHSFVVGDALYVSAAGVWLKARSNDPSTLEVQGIIPAGGIIDANTFQLTLPGSRVDLTGALWGPAVAGTTYYLSDATAGRLTATAPTAVGSIAKTVVLCVSGPTDCLVLSVPSTPLTHQQVMARIAMAGG